MGRHALPVDVDRVHGRRSADPSASAAGTLMVPPVSAQLAATPAADLVQVGAGAEPVVLEAKSIEVAAPVAARRKGNHQHRGAVVPSRARRSRNAAPSRHAACMSLARRLDAVVTTPVVDSVVHARRVIGAKRVALIAAPLLALTSGIAFAAPANAVEVTTPVARASQSQQYVVASDVTIPVMTDGATTATEVVSYPTLVLSGGATETQARTALSAVLSKGGNRATIINTALAYLGDQYVEGGASHSGIDCSGLVMVAYQAVGIQLAHYVPTQDAAATTIPESEAQAGDLVVYDNEDHIGLYLGNGLVLQAPHPGEPVDIIPMFSAAHHFARVLPAG